MRDLIRACDAQHGIGQSEDDQFDGREMTKRLVEALCRERHTQVTPGCQALYLHSARWINIKGLENFKNVRVLHLENNCLSSCEGLGHMAQLRALYLQQNQIASLSGLAECTCLVSLCVSQNPLGTIEPGCLPASLLTLQAASTGLSQASDVQALASDCPELQVLDVQHNTGLADDQTLLPALCSLKCVRVLYTQGCPLSSTSNYRRVLVSSLPNLHYLDDRPVDEVERAGALAWLAGGRDAEQAARLAWREEHKRQQRRTTVAFAVERAKRRMIKALGGEAVMAEPLLQEDTHTLVSRLVDEHIWQPAAALPDTYCSTVMSTGVASDYDWWCDMMALLQPQPHLQRSAADAARSSRTHPSSASALEADTERNLDDDAATALPQPQLQPSVAGVLQSRDEPLPSHDMPEVHFGSETLQWVSKLRSTLKEFVLSQGAADGSGQPAEKAGQPAAVRGDADCVNATEAGSPNASVVAEQAAQLAAAQDPATASVDEQLNAHAATFPQRNSISGSVQPVECAVCAEELVPGQQVVYLPCAHPFHSTCIKQWVLTWLCSPQVSGGINRPAAASSVTCPVCRTPLPLPQPPPQLIAQLASRRQPAPSHPTHVDHHAVHATSTLQPTAATGAGADDVLQLPRLRPAKTTTAGIIMHILGSQGVHLLPQQPRSRGMEPQPEVVAEPSNADQGTQVLDGESSSQRACSAGQATKPPMFTARPMGLDADLALWNKIKQERKQARSLQTAAAADQQHVPTTTPESQPSAPRDSCPCDDTPTCQLACEVVVQSHAPGSGRHNTCARDQQLPSPATQPAATAHPNPSTTMQMQAVQRTDAMFSVPSRPTTTQQPTRTSYIIHPASVQAVHQAIAHARLSSSARPLSHTNISAVGSTAPGGAPARLSKAAVDDAPAGRAPDQASRGSRSRWQAVPPSCPRCPEAKPTQRQSEQG